MKFEEIYKKNEVQAAEKDMQENCFKSRLPENFYIFVLFHI